ncbi:hypothetical protein F5Y18DRAFT_437819, partial [Xylariaceae sp. FL1019]
HLHETPHIYTHKHSHNLANIPPYLLPFTLLPTIVLTSAVKMATNNITAAEHPTTMTSVTVASPAADDNVSAPSIVTVAEELGALSLTPPSPSTTSLAGSLDYPDYYAGYGSETDPELTDDNDSDSESDFDSDPDTESDLDEHQLAPATSSDQAAPTIVERETLERAYELIQDRTLISSDGLLVVSIAASEKNDEKVLEEIEAIKSVYNSRRLALRRKQKGREQK